MILNAQASVTNPDGRGLLAPVGVAVHHSVTDIGAGASEEQERRHIEAIDRYHVQVGYGGFAYHLAVFPSGRVYLTGELDGMRAHVEKRNHELIGIVAIGTFTTDLPKQPQLEAIIEGIRYVREQTGKTLLVKGHNSWVLQGLAGTICAGVLNNVDWEALLRMSPAVVTHSQELLRGMVLEAITNKYLLEKIGENPVGEWIVEAKELDGKTADPRIIVAVLPPGKRR